MLLFVLWLTAAPPGADPNGAVGQWVRTLKDWRGAGCCDLSDCRPVDVRYADDGRPEVWIDERFPGRASGGWVPVPDQVLEGTTAKGEAPDTRSWACWYAGKLMCFIAGGGI